MKLHVVALSALLLAPFTAASAQVTTSSGDASQRVYNWCMKRPNAVAVECGCVSGFYGAYTADDEFRILARMVEYFQPDGGIKDQDAMVAAIREEANGQGMTNDRLREILAGFETFSEVGAFADQICVPLIPLDPSAQAAPPADAPATVW